MHVHGCSPVVDGWQDAPVNHFVVRALLHQTPHTLECLQDGLQTMSAIDSFMPDVLLLDAVRSDFRLLCMYAVLRMSCRSWARCMAPPSPAQSA
jgi:hypothetical protein